MYTFRPLSQLTFEEALNLWNRGFEGYIAPVHFDEKMYLSRFGKLDLSPELSVVAYHQEQPVGFVMQAFGAIDGKKLPGMGEPG